MVCKHAVHLKVKHFNLGFQQFNWRKSICSRCLIEVQQISFIPTQGVGTRHHPRAVAPKRLDKVVQVNRRWSELALQLWRDFQRIRCWLVALVLPALENQVSDKRVESILFPRLDEGSSPSWSTKHTDFQCFTYLQRQKERQIKGIKAMALFC